MRQKRHGYRLPQRKDRRRALPGGGGWRDDAHFHRTGPAFRPNGLCDAGATTVERFFHDVSWYGGGPVTPSKISMMIICP